MFFKSFNKFLFPLMLMALLFVCLIIGSVSAGTVTIDNATSGGIQAAIDSSVGSGDDGTVNLKSGNYDVSHGSVNVAPLRRVTINGLGTGKSKTILDAKGQNRVFNVSGPSLLVLNNLVIKNGRSNNGGAIYLENGGVEINNCDFVNNIASNEGGVIYTSNQYALNFETSTFVNNSAVDGGVVYSENMEGVSSFKNSNFTNNRVSGNGGVVYTDYRLSIEECYFVNNNAGNNGGVVYINGINNSNYIKDLRSSFINNSANFNGSVYYLSGFVGEISLSVSDFIANRAISNGGAIFINIINDFNFNIRANKFINNDAINGLGSVIYNTATNGNVTLDSSIISGNNGKIFYNQNSNCSFVVNGSFWSIGDLNKILNTVVNVDVPDFFVVKLVKNNVSKYGDDLLLSFNIVNKDNDSYGFWRLPNMIFDIVYNGQKRSVNSSDMYDSIEFKVNRLGVNNGYLSFNGLKLSELNFTIGRGIVRFVPSVKEAYFNKTKTFKVQLFNSGNFTMNGVWVYFYANGKYIGKNKTNSNGTALLKSKLAKTGSNNMTFKYKGNNYYISGSKVSKVYVPPVVMTTKSNAWVKKRFVTFRTTVYNYGPKRADIKLRFYLPVKFVAKTNITSKIVGTHKVKVNGKVKVLKNYKKAKITFKKSYYVVDLVLNGLKSKKKVVMYWQMKAKKGKYNFWPYVMNQTKNSKLLKNNYVKVLVK